jgi:hypothetical protein
MSDANTFMGWTLESVVEALRRHSDGPWITGFFERYLDFDRMDRLVASP